MSIYIGQIMSEKELAMIDVVVIGGGIAGLTAAAFAARSGAETLLIEANGDFGGRAATREISGFRFNVGPHALYLGGAAMRTLGVLGIDPPGAPPPTSGSWFVRQGALHPMAGEAADSAGSSLLQGTDALEFGRAYQAIAAGFRGQAGDTIARALSRLTSNPLARSVLDAQVRVSTYSNSPEAVDAAAVFDQLRLALHGVRYLDEGWASMIAALAQAAGEAGAQVRTGRRVLSVERLAEDWRVTCAGGEIVDAAAVVLAVAPPQAAGLAGMEIRSDLCPARAASLDIALSRLPDPDRTFALGLDEPTYFSVHSHTARGLAPEGGALIHVARYLAPGETCSTAVRAELEALLDLLQPGWREVLVHAQWLPQVNVTHDQPQALHGGLGGRTPVETAAGLLLAGDWVGNEGMLADAAFASGRQAGELAGAVATARPRAA
jgi:phytoene dehydrogenase-like protein